MNTTAIYAQPITTIDDAKRFIDALVANGDCFHFDDDVQDIIWANPKTSDELAQLDARRNETYQFNWGPLHDCPIGYALHAIAINDAAMLTDLDDACAIVQAAIGQTDGGVAGIFFSGPEGEEYPTADGARRAELLRDYIKLEETYATND